MVFHFRWLYTPGWAELIALILGGGVLLAFVLRQLVKWSAVDERKRIELVLQAYTFKILHHYIDNKQLPSITELKEMQREAIEHPPETWEYVSQKAVELWRKANQGKAEIDLRKLAIRMLRRKTI